MGIWNRRRRIEEEPGKGSLLANKERGGDSGASTARKRGMGRGKNH